MSLFRKPKFQRFGSSWENIADFFAGRNRRRPAGKHRTLKIDPLEERMLLTVSTTTLLDQAVNQTSGVQSTSTTSSSGST